MKTNQGRLVISPPLRQPENRLLYNRAPLAKAFFDQEQANKATGGGLVEPHLNKAAAFLPSCVIGGELLFLFLETNTQRLWVCLSGAREK